MSEIVIWGYRVAKEGLSETELAYLLDLPKDLPGVDWVWQEMDRVWQTFNLNNKTALKDQKIAEFYQHPVWLLNGIFTAMDPESAAHRRALAKYVSNMGVKHIADYGGGFGELAMAIIRENPAVKVSIIEPFPSAVGLARLRDIEQITFTAELSENHYDAIIAQDVLEHVEDPVLLAYEIAKAVPVGGKVIFANCFYPVIECHLPATYHLRHTFPIVMKTLGLTYLEKVIGTANGQVFERSGSLNLSRARQAEAVSRFVGPVINVLRTMLSKIKQRLLRLL